MEFCFEIPTLSPVYHVLGGLPAPVPQDTVDKRVQQDSVPIRLLQSLSVQLVYPGDVSSVYIKVCSREVSVGIGLHPEVLLGHVLHIYLPVKDPLVGGFFDVVH